MRRAVIDVGSNSILLLVAKSGPDGWKTLIDFSAVTGLGTGISKSGTLSPRAVQSTLQAVQHFFEVAIAMGCDRIHAAGTMAVRTATNQHDFLELAAKQGTPIAVLSEASEAMLGFLAVSNFRPIEDQLWTIDPGGNSTEIVGGYSLKNPPEVIFRESFPIGTLRLKDGALSQERTEPASLLAASTEIDKVFQSNPPPAASGSAVVLGATGTNLVAIRDKVVPWNPELVDGSELTYEEVSRSASWLGGMSEAERALLPGIEKGRERTLPAGALILERALSLLGVEKCTVSVRGWRHALLEDPQPQKWFV